MHAMIPRKGIAVTLSLFAIAISRASAHGQGNPFVEQALSHEKGELKKEDAFMLRHLMDEKVIKCPQEGEGGGNRRMCLVEMPL